MKTYTIVVLDREGDWLREDVSEATYLYIRQMESFIKSPKQSKFFEKYSERFADRYKYEQLKDIFN